VESLLATRVYDPDPVRSRRRADVIARLVVSYAVSAPDDPPEVVAASMADFLAVGAEPVRPVGSSSSSVGSPQESP
jgi:hypothetical protein